jgi:hypothetical protein
MPVAELIRDKKILDRVPIKQKFLLVPVIGDRLIPFSGSSGSLPSLFL